MEGLIIPGWAVVLISTFGGAAVYWFIWLTKKTYDNDKAIAINNNNDSNSNSELQKITNKIDKLDDKVDRVMDQLIRITR